MAKALGSQIAKHSASSISQIDSPDPYSAYATATGHWRAVHYSPALPESPNPQVRVTSTVQYITQKSSIVLSSQFCGHSTMKRGSTLLGIMQLPKKAQKKQKQDFWRENRKIRMPSESVTSVEDKCDGSQEDQTVGRVRWTIKKTLDRVFQKAPDSLASGGHSFC